MSADLAPIVMHGECVALMGCLPDNSIDAIVTDPPYGLGFMGKAWDDLPPGIEWAAECLRVLKPGGHMLAFGGTRTWHRLAVAVEDAGFEMRDSIAWLYGSGFPKSLDVSKAIDKANGKHERDLAPFGAYVRERREAKGWSLRQLDEAMGTNTAASWWEGRKSGVQPPGLDVYRKLKTVLDMAPIYDELIEWLEAERAKIGTIEVPLGHAFAGSTYGGDSASHVVDITAPATDAARQWQGWGTALKPAFEPVVMARKPLVGTVAANVLAHGTGALNIDACRIEGVPPSVPQPKFSRDMVAGFGASEGRSGDMSAASGRWPANVALDEDQAAALDQQSGNLKSGDLSKHHKRATAGGNGLTHGSMAGIIGQSYGDTGGASRFFYVAKAPAKERPKVDGVAHPTVKPVALMRWLIRLVTPPGGTVLDPFAGSGTTLEAAALEGFPSIGIEREADYLPLIAARMARVA